MNPIELGKITLLSLVFQLTLNAAFAQSKLEFNDEKPIKDQVITSGMIKVSVTYEPIKIDNPADTADPKNVSYKIFYQNQLYLEESGYNFLAPGYVELKDLDANGTPEVIVSTYSGGAHCCTSLIIYTWQKDKFLKTETGFMDGAGGSFEDLDKDGKYEFVTLDNAFYYAFSPYAMSFPPSKIYALKDGKFIDITRKYPKELRSALQEMYNAFRTAKKEKYEVNGVLAGYVAQKILLGEYEEGWKFLLANYDKTSDWGLNIYRDSEVIGKYPNFPTALKAFLIANGYLTKNGQPIH